MMTPEQFENIKQIWHDYKHDATYNTIGNLNLVAVLGERSGMMIAEIERLQKEHSDLNAKPCEWKVDYDGSWETTCGKEFEFYDGGPQFNGFRYCPFCRREILEAEEGVE